MVQRGSIALNVGYFSTLRWGWVFLERTRILSGIQFTMYFIDYFAVETKRFVGSLVNCKRDLDTANLRPALEQSCGKQTLSDRKLFSRANLLYVPNIKV